MAATAAIVVNSSNTENAGGRQYRVWGKLTFANAAAGGYNAANTPHGNSFTAAQFGLTTIDYMIVQPPLLADGTGALTVLPAVNLLADGSGGNLQAFGSAVGATGIAEIADTTDLSLRGPLVYEIYGV